MRIRVLALWTIGSSRSIYYLISLYVLLVEEFLSHCCFIWQHSSATMPFWIPYLNPVVYHMASFFLFLSRLSCCIRRGFNGIIASLFFCILSSVCLGLLDRLDISRKCAIWLWVLKEAINILYLCMSFLSGSFYPFVVSFDIWKKTQHRSSLISR